MLWLDERVEGGQHAVSAVRGGTVRQGRARSSGPADLPVRDLRPPSNRSLHLGLPRRPLPRRHHRARRALVSAFPLALCRYVELLAERGVQVDASTVFDWVQHFTPLYKDAARPHRHRVGTRWAVDETSMRLAARWVYAYRASDERGQVIDVYLSETRDTAAATAFFERAIDQTDVRPRRVTTDKAPTYPPALRAVVPDAEHVTGKMEQQGIERDHQHLKGRTRSMRGFQQLRCAQVVCDGHGFMRNLRDGFYRLGEPTGDPRLPRAPRLLRAWDDLTHRLAAA